MKKRREQGVGRFKLGKFWEKLGDEDAEKNIAPHMHGAEVENLAGSRT